MRLLRTVSSILPVLNPPNTQTDQGLTKWNPNDPVITIINTAFTPQAYDVETDSQSPPGTFPSCTSCITVPARATIRFHPGPRFNGALTSHQHRGTRHELNFLASPGACWYDADMERGISDETLGPSDHRAQADGSPSLVGEADPLAKANAAWAHATPDTQRALLASGYVQGVVGGALSAVKMDLQAPPVMVDWLQIDAAFDAYVATGSVAGHGRTAADAVADGRVRNVGTTQMTITVYG